MRAIALFLASAALVAAPLSAQVAARKLGTAPASRPRPAVLSVRYAAIAGTKMTLTTPAGSFACTTPSAPAGLPMATCTLAVARGATVALTANYLILGPAAQVGMGTSMRGTSMRGKQWAGDCAGTISDTCTLAMTEDRTVTLSPYAAP